MGLFTNRPEEPTEWAGLPSEPLEPESAAERLGAPIALGLGGLFGEGAGSVASVTISVGPDVESAAHGASPEPGAD